MGVGDDFIYNTVKVSSRRLVKMAEQTVTRVSAEEYMEHYAHDYYEWVGGEIIKMSPVQLVHKLLETYLLKFLEAYFALKPIGTVVGAPFVMRVDATDSRREPDLQVILKTNPGQLTDTAMIGPADICIEVVSPESVARDYGEKFAEYERGGVREFWLVDTHRNSCLFYRLNEEKVYTLQPLDTEDHYHTPLLPGFALHVPTLWQDPLPDYFAIAEAVKTMVKSS
jgi:Uma2 family endonuclease